MYDAQLVFMRCSIVSTFRGIRRILERVEAISLNRSYNARSFFPSFTDAGHHEIFVDLVGTDSD